MNLTGMKFGAQGSRPSDTNGFGNAIFDPSLKKLKEDINMKENQNRELEDQITRLRYILQDNVGENDIVIGLQKELDIKES